MSGGGTLVYAPGVKVQVDTARNGIIDVSDDIVRGSVELQVGRGGQPHQLGLTLLNDRRKYDGVFTPNDRVVVFLKRIKWLQIMSGYLNSVPMVSIYNQNVSLSAYCSLKRALFSLYDPGAPATVNLLNTSGADMQSTDSGLTDKAQAVLTEMVGWDANKIHMGGIPLDWFADISGLYQSLKKQFRVPAMTGAMIGGASLLNEGLVQVQVDAGGSQGEAEVDEGPGYGQLPSLGGKVTAIAASDWDLYPTAQATSNIAWPIAMRWPYQTVTSHNPSNPYLTDAQVTYAKRWWREHNLLIVNDKTQKAIVVQPVTWGPPADSKYDLALGQAALDALGAKRGDSLGVRFAKEDVEPGAFATTSPTSISGSVQNDSSTDNWSDVGKFGKGPGESGVSADDGVVFAAADNLKANCAAARSFIYNAWGRPPGSIGGWRATGSVSTSDHPLGLALDVMLSDGTAEPTPEQVALGNSVAFFFVQNPHLFGTKYVIWNNMIYQASGAKPYIRDDGGQTSINLGHRNHVHISFEDTGQTSLGSSGSGWTITAQDFMVSAAVGGVIHQDRATSISAPDTNIAATSGTGIGTRFVTAWDWSKRGDPLSFALTGPRRLLNDSPVWPLIESLMQTGMREWCSAPNGDFIAWFPDYFNLYGTLSRMVLQTIEMEPFNVEWSDLSLVTHQFVTGSTGGAFAPNAQAQMAARQSLTQGIATVEFPELLKTLLNVDPDDPRSAAWLDPQAILQRFGARVNHEQAPWITSPEGEFWQAVHLFRQNWASQFSTTINLSFLPELFPGMILQIPEYGIQFYVDSVTHNFDLGPDGGGFTTSARAIAPSTIGAQKGLYGLPRGGHWIGDQTQGSLATGPDLDIPDDADPAVAGTGWRAGWNRRLL